jgi:two-component system chemotaxis sensor kinase CheA
MDELLAEFLIETQESLAELDNAVMRLEREPDDPHAIALTFRHIHTIKGTCGFLRLPRLEAVAHAAEAVLSCVRDGDVPVSSELVSLILATLDRVRLILDGLKTSEAEPAGDDSALISALEMASRGQAPSSQPSMADAVSIPANDDMGEAREASPSIRVPVDCLEHLMTLAGELVLIRNQLRQLARNLETSSFYAPFELLSQVTSELQTMVLKARMQPIRSFWSKLPRIVRDLAHELGKNIVLKLDGAETELDRQVLELIRDPLIHMIRNAADHGVETPAERRAIGKPECGIIALRAHHQAGHVVIELADDGRGLSVERIRSRAAAQGLATESELAGLSPAQLYQFIFRPGFSTAGAVTALSGRGVGMDVVKTNIDRIGGAIDLSSRPDAGTTITMRIPLTLAFVTVLIVAVRNHRFAIPQLSIVQVIRLKDISGEGETAIERIGDVNMLRFRGRFVPLVSLCELLRLTPDAQSSDAALILVIQVGAVMLGLMVERVIDTEDVVVKPVAPILRHIALFGGITILGDGSVVMILDPKGIALGRGLTEGNGSVSRAQPGPQSSDERTRLLLFRAGGSSILAVPLKSLFRIESIPRAAIETTQGQTVTQYRGRLMPLVSLANTLDQSGPQQLILVLREHGRSGGLMIDEIVDVVEDRALTELPATTPGILGTGVIGGRAADVIDTRHWASRLWPDLFATIDTSASGGDPPVWMAA